MYFDTHTHANFAAFQGETDEVVKRALDQGVWMVNVGTSLQSSQSAAKLATGYEQGVYAAVGLHPIHTWQEIKDPDESASFKQETFQPEAFKELLDGKVVAVGETGLDYYRVPPENREAIKLQKEAFARQLAFAKEAGLPVIIHCRDAYKDLLEILKSEYAGGTGIIHSFTGAWETAKDFLDLGFYIALNGILTFDKTGRLAQVCRNLPSDRILSETDAPYLAPPPHRGRRNEPAYVKLVVAEIARLRGIPEPDMAAQTFENARRVFRLK